jgi:hypothetical protein
MNRFFRHQACYSLLQLGQTEGGTRRGSRNRYKVLGKAFEQQLYFCVLLTSLNTAGGG